MYKKLVDRENAYTTSAKSIADGADYYNAGIIAATVAAAGAIAFSHGVAATNIIAGAGIGATALTMAYQPTSRAAQLAALATGTDQLECLQGYMDEYLIIQKGAQRQNELETKVTALKTSISDATALIGKTPPAADATPANLATLTEAIIDASAAGMTAQTELNSYLQLDATVTNTYRRVDAAVRKAMDPTYLSYSPPKPNGGTVPAPSGSEHTKPGLEASSLLSEIPALPAPSTTTPTADAIKNVQGATNAVKANEVVKGQIFSAAVSKIASCANGK